MGIQDRDYMKRRSADDDERSSASESPAEEFFGRFLERNPRFFIYAGAALVLIALLVAKFSGGSH